ncbi:MAG: hypothetical protein CVV42_10635 [Candidatus Riflebacteria bacterium HGW-Riflebacteria-2]|jgi:hypothetical protein|nr:MAG: hypothetical protein CVV42_10635 [Candidatus Riflebacteria bacterium HGW-Riflebacteria-2]
MNPTFTDEQHAARWLARFALPFVNAEPDQLRETAFNAYAQNTSKIWRCDGTDEVVEEFDFERYDIYRNTKSEELAALQKLIQTMLYIVLSGKKHEELPKDIKRQVESIEKAIKLVSTGIEYSYEWKGRGKAHTLRIAKDGDGLISRLKEWFVLAITNCLYSFSLADEIEPMKGQGFEKIGMCPNCGIFFEKRRKDQEYCSARCQQTMAVRRVREKQKKLL